MVIDDGTVGRPLTRLFGTVVGGLRRGVVSRLRVSCLDSGSVRSSGGMLRLGDLISLLMLADVGCWPYPVGALARLCTFLSSPSLAFNG